MLFKYVVYVYMIHVKLLKKILVVAVVEINSTLHRRHHHQMNVLLCCIVPIYLIYHLQQFRE